MFPRLCITLATASLLTLVISGTVARLSVSAQQSGVVTPVATQTPASAESMEAAPENQRTGLPEWAYTPATPAALRSPRVPDDGTVLHLPGSSKGYTRTQINDQYGSPDWFPESHPPQPKPVSEGGKPRFAACGECHLANGNGKPDTAGLNGLSAAYILQQIEDFRTGKRHASVLKMTALDMIPIAKGITPEEAKLAADYFASVKTVKWIRVVETEMVPKTNTIAHRLVVVPDAPQEPIGNRIVEVPENEAYTVMRDSQSGFVAYVPKGSLKKGEALVKTGGNGRTMACVMCHGQDLKGMGNVIPAIAGRSPSYVARQLYDFKAGARNGANASLMKGPVANLTDEDVVDITAYLASLEQ